MIRQKIVDEIKTQLETISNDNGFYTNAGKNIFEWLEKPLEEGEYPALILRDPSSSASDDFTVAAHRLKIEIDIAIKSKNAPWNMREATSDVIKAFGVVEENLSLQCKFLGSEFLIEQKDYLYAGVRVEFEVIYKSRRWEQ